MTQPTSITFKSGYPSRSVKPEVAYREIEKIRKKGKGKITAETLVDAVQSNQRHPLRTLFNWDDTQAAAEYRKEQARKLLRSIVITVAEAPKQPMRAYNVTVLPQSQTEEKPVKVYASTTDLLADEDGRAELLAEALRMLVQCQKRFRCLQELAPIFRELNTVLETIEP